MLKHHNSFKSNSSKGKSPYKDFFSRKYVASNSPNSPLCKQKQANENSQHETASISVEDSGIHDTMAMRSKANKTKCVKSEPKKPAQKFTKTTLLHNHEKQVQETLLNIMNNGFNYDNFLFTNKNFRNDRNGNGNQETNNTQINDVDLYEDNKNGNKFGICKLLSEAVFLSLVNVQKASWVGLG